MADQLSQVLKEIKTIKQTMATKRDLEGMAAKEDLRRMATKDDIRYATDSLREDIDLSMETKFIKYRDQIMNKIDGLAGRLLKQDQEETIHIKQHEVLDDIPERVGKLEEIHPQGHHPR